MSRFAAVDVTCISWLTVCAGAGHDDGVDIAVVLGAVSADLDPRTPWAVS